MEIFDKFVVFILIKNNTVQTILEDIENER